MKRRHALLMLGTAGALTALGIRPRVMAAEPPPETLHDEGFAHVMYPNIPSGPVSQHLAAGDADISMNFIAPNIIRLELGDPVVFLAGAHVACFELVGTDRVRQIRDLRGKTAAVESAAPNIFPFPALPPTWGWIRKKTSNDQPSPRSNRSGCSRRGKWTRSWAFRQQPRSCGRGRSHVVGQQRDGSSVVPVFLLPRNGEPRVREKESSRHQAGLAGHLEVGGYVRQSTRAGGAGPRRQGVYAAV